MSARTRTGKEIKKGGKGDSRHFYFTSLLHLPVLEVVPDMTTAPVSDTPVAPSRERNSDVIESIRSRITRSRANAKFRPFTALRRSGQLQRTRQHGKNLLIYPAWQVKHEMETHLPQFDSDALSPPGPPHVLYIVPHNTPHTTPHNQNTKHTPWHTTGLLIVNCRTQNTPPTQPPPPHPQHPQTPTPHHTTKHKTHPPTTPPPHHQHHKPPHQHTTKTQNTPPTQPPPPHPTPNPHTTPHNQNTKHTPHTTPPPPPTNTHKPPHHTNNQNTKHTHNPPPPTHQHPQTHTTGLLIVNCRHTRWRHTCPSSTVTPCLRPAHLSCCISYLTILSPGTPQAYLLSTAVTRDGDTPAPVRQLLFPIDNFETLSHKVFVTPDTYTDCNSYLSIPTDKAHFFLSSKRVLFCICFDDKNNHNIGFDEYEDIKPDENPFLRFMRKHNNPTLCQVTYLSYYTSPTCTSTIATRTKTTGSGG
ncbi:hypothetical protein J6590_052010 [Homalodisca vitripennis]|nr:hypothetical protein J6590_052010 [Homalodisca vitripennis]